MFKRFRSIAFVGYAVVLAAAAAIVFVADQAVHAAFKACAVARHVALSLLFGPQEIHAGTDVRVATREKSQASEFIARIEKRERPTITSSWRMCPSC